VRLIALLREIEGGCAVMFALGLPSGRLAGIILVKRFACIGSLTSNLQGFVMATNDAMKQTARGFSK
jgi:hypothetical protein